MVGGGSLSEIISQRGIRHRVRPLPRIHVDDLYKWENRAFALGKQPFVLLGVAANASALAQLGTAEFFINGPFASATADYYPLNMDDKDVRPYLTPMAAAVRELLQPSGAFPGPNVRNPGRYLHFNMRWEHWHEMLRLLGPLRLPDFMASPDRWLQAAFDSDGERSEFQLTSHWRMVLIGTDGAGMFNHPDTLSTASYQLQLAGAKLWHVCAPAQGAHLSADHDMLRPDYARFPEALAADCFLERVGAGELVYYPRDYWHQTLNEPAAAGALSVSFTDTLVDGGGREALAAGLRENCVKPPLPGINPSPQLCAKFAPRLFPWWERAWGAAAGMEAGGSSSSSSSSAAHAATVQRVPLAPPPLQHPPAALGGGSGGIDWRTCDLGPCDAWT